MIVGVADTHTALWYLFSDARLSAVARDFIRGAAGERSKVAISSISLVELVYLVEKGRVLSSAYEDLVRALADPEHLFVEAAVSAAIVESMRLVSRAEVPDMPDRIVAATGLYLSVPVISRDRRIRAASLKTIW
jgi:PIN domain nuclease of toxin-antitoxin system